MTNNSLIKKYLDEDDENENLSSSCALNENKSDIAKLIEITLI
jgi:hypothetical protein